MTSLRAEGITKEFPGVLALDRVDFDLEKGEIHAIVGENGAGKSTLVKLLSGVYKPSSGKMIIDGREVSFSSPHAAAPYVGVVHQERELVPFFSGATNLFLGQEIERFGFLQRARMRKRALEFKTHYDMDLDLDIPAGELGSGKQEMLTILKVLFRSPGIVIFDEPTAALSVGESEILFRLIRDLRDSGKSIVYISHHLPEVLDLCDRITVLRNGKKVATVGAGETTEEQLIKLMIAKDLEAQYPKSVVEAGRDRLRVRSYSAKRAGFSHIDFHIASGEIVGFAGLVGAGRTELAKALFEGSRGATGEVVLDGKPFMAGSPRDSILRGLVMIPEDRRGEGLVPCFDVGENLSLPRLFLLSRLGFKQGGKIERRSRKIVDELAIKVFSTNQSVTTLSGGNQQKVSLGKWFDAEAGVWIFDEPTQGIDVETKSEIYGIMEKMAKAGAAIWFISSDLRELEEIADRIYVMKDSSIAGEFRRPFSTEDILMAMLGKNAGKRTES
jgi:ABC-type sugar transport system ATPase subunit